MSGQQRGLIRAAAGDQIQYSLDSFGYTGALFNGRRADARNIKKFITVAIERGDIEPIGLSLQAKAELVVLIADSKATDDELDALGDVVSSGLMNDPYLGGIISGLRLTSFEYPDDEQQAFSMLVLRYEITYQP